MNQITEQIAELNQTYSDLGEDLVLLVSVLQAVRRGSDFPPGAVTSSLSRVADYIEQHTGAIKALSRYLTEINFHRMVL